MIINKTYKAHFAEIQCAGKKKAKKKVVYGREENGCVSNFTLESLE